VSDSQHPEQEVRQRVARGQQHREWSGAPCFDLRTAAFAVQALLAEVLAVVREDPVAALTEARTGALNDVLAIEARPRTDANPDISTVRELLERDFLHRSATQAPRKPGVTDHPSVGPTYSP